MTTVNLTVSSADQVAFNGAGMFVIGAPKSGKSVLACTASKDAPKPLNPKTKTILSDILYLQLEPRGVSSAVALGLVPKHVIDLSAPEYLVPVNFEAQEVSRKSSNDALLDWTKVRPALLAAAKYAQANPEIKIVVIDNLSGFSDMAAAHFLANSKDGFEAWAKVKQANEWIFNLFRMNRLLVVGLSHTKALAQGSDENKLETKSVGGEVTQQVPAMPTGSAGFWAKATDATVVTLRKKVKSAGGYDMKYSVAFTSSAKQAAGNRYNIVGEVEAHLRDIIKANYNI